MREIRLDDVGQGYRLRAWAVRGEEGGVTDSRFHQCSTRAENARRSSSRSHQRKAIPLPWTLPTSPLPPRFRWNIRWNKTDCLGCSDPQEWARLAMLAARWSREGGDHNPVPERLMGKFGSGLGDIAACLGRGMM